MANGVGGGLWNKGSAMLNNDTFFFNRTLVSLGAGIRAASGTLAMRNSIVAGRSNWDGGQPD